LFAINTKTLDEYIEVLEHLFGQGMCWHLFGQGMCWHGGLTSIRTDFWEDYRQSTCIVVNKEVITYCGCKYFTDTYDKDLLNMEQFREKMNANYRNVLKKKYDLK